MSEQPLALSLEIRLKPSETGREQLQHWPATPFSPDFTVASSGVVQISLNDRFPAMQGGHVVAVSRAEVTEAVNLWWPDYVGGFALNLGRAVASLHKGAAHTKASFVDEPVALTFQRQPESGEIMVGFEANGKQLITAALPEIELRTQVRRSLQDFVAQLMHINPQLATQADVQELNRQIQSLT